MLFLFLANTYHHLIEVSSYLKDEMVLSFCKFFVNFSNLKAQVLTYSEADFDDELIRYSVGNILRLLEGAFGAMIMVVAGIVSIINTAVGKHKQWLTLVIVALFAYMLRSLVSLFFGIDFPAYDTTNL